VPYLRPIEIVQGQTAFAEFVLDYETTLSASDFTVTFERLSGETLATLSVTVDSYSTTVASVTNDSTVVAASSASRVSGEPVLHVPVDGVPSRLWVSSYSNLGSTAALGFESSPVSPFATGDALKGCLARAEVPSSLTADLGVNYRIRWVITEASAASTVRSIDQRVYVVRSGFPPTPSISDAARFVQANYPSEYEIQGGEKLRRVTFAAQDKLRNELMGRGRYAHLTGADSSTFAEAGLIALQSTLLMEGYFHADIDRVQYADSLNKRFFGSVMTGLRSLQYYDANADGIIADSEKVKFGGIPANRY
jgi:hypothetical protein